MEFLLTEAEVRLGCFIGVFVAMAAWESFAPRRSLLAGKPLRWGSNLGLVAIHNVLMRLAAPLGGVGIAFFAAAQGWGLFHYVDAPHWVAILVSVVLFDLAIYLQHVLAVAHGAPCGSRL